MVDKSLGVGIQLRNRLRNYILYVPITIKNKNNTIQNTIQNIAFIKIVSVSPRQ